MSRRLWYPLPGPQTMAYYSEADELFYGGAAGGGKTDLLIGLATTAQRRSIIFRRELTQLQPIVDRSIEIIGTQGIFNANLKRWQLNDGRLLEFGGAERENDVQKYQGRPHDFKGFDELPHFTEYQYRFLTGWTRTTIPGQRTRIVGAGNPPTDSDGEWVIRRWKPWLDEQHPHPATPGELRWFAIIDGVDTELGGPTAFVYKGETVQPKSRTFIPARLADNPYLMAQGYAATLQGMPEPLRSQMLYGDFKAGLIADPWQIIPTDWVKLAQQRWRDRPKPDLPQSAIGVDVARGGDDQTVIACRYGDWLAPLHAYPGTATPNGQVTAAFVLQAREGETAVNLDIIGVGAAAYDALLQSDAPNLIVSPVNFGAGTTATDRTGQLGFANVRAEAWWHMREILDPVSGEAIALPDDAELLSDLCAPRWKPVARGIQVESKEDIVKRIRRSPDKGDATVLAFYPIFAPLRGI